MSGKDEVDASVIEHIKLIKTEIARAKKTLAKVAKTLGTECASDPDNPIRHLKKADFKAVSRLVDDPLNDPELLFEKEFESSPACVPYRAYLEKKGLLKAIESSDMVLHFDSGTTALLIEEDLSFNEQKLPGFALPKDVFTWLKFSTATRGRYLGLGPIEFALERNEELRRDILDGKLPPFMIRFVVLGVGERGLVGTWLLPPPAEEGPILLFDRKDSSIGLISGSMGNLLKRARECRVEGVDPDCFEPSRRTLEIIGEIDGEGVLPDGPMRSLDDVANWPEDWKRVAEPPVDLGQITRRGEEERREEMIDALFTDDLLKEIGFDEDEIEEMKEERDRGRNED